MDAIQKIEPVAWRRKEAGGWWVYYETRAHDDLEPLYADQTLASKEAELVRVRDALAWSEQLNRRPGEGHNECFERIAEVFYRKTGHMRPGKDASPGSGVSMDERQAAWDAWIAEGIAKMRAALKQPTE